VGGIGSVFRELGEFAARTAGHIVNGEEGKTAASALFRRVFGHEAESAAETSARIAATALVEPVSNDRGVLRALARGGDDEMQKLARRLNVLDNQIRASQDPVVKEALSLEQAAGVKHLRTLALSKAEQNLAKAKISNPAGVRAAEKEVRANTLDLARATKDEGSLLLKSSEEATRSAGRLAMLRAGEIYLGVGKSTASSSAFSSAVECFMRVGSLDGLREVGRASSFQNIATVVLREIRTRAGAGSHVDAQLGDWFHALVNDARANIRAIRYGAAPLRPLSRRESDDLIAQYIGQPRLMTMPENWSAP
jgi:hypothetical protein